MLIFLVSAIVWILGKCCVYTLGVLQVGVMNGNSQTNEKLPDSDLAAFTFPSGIDIQQLIGGEQEDVGIFFVTYDRDALFPRREERNNQTEQDPVGSAVVGFTIAGLPPGTVLPKPVLINFGIADPVTGSSEVYFYLYELKVGLLIKWSNNINNKVNNNISDNVPLKWLK